MSETDQTHDAGKSSDELKARLCNLVDALVSRDEGDCESEFVHLIDRVWSLVDRKLRMEGAKSDTRDFLGELLFTRIRRGMQTFFEGEEGDVAPMRAAEWVMGALFSVTTLSEFARAFDKALLRSSSGRDDFNFAGRTDFINVEEVMQMLSSGKHLGCLSLEKDDNRLDIYMKDGRIFFLDPHQIVRRVMPSDEMGHREIPQTKVVEAEACRAKTGQPALLALLEAGVFGDEEMRDVLRLFGREALFDFMQSEEPYAFYYRKLADLPAFAVDHDVRLGVTSILLEGSKLLDDWKQMLEVFPDPDAPIEPTADMFASMGDAAMGVIELKLLSNINGDISPRSLAPILGLPLFEVYDLLIRLSREGVIAVPGEASVASMRLGVEASMQEAMAALDANDDDQHRQSVIDRAFGEEEEDEAEPAVRDGAGSAVQALESMLAGDDAGHEDEDEEDDGDLDKELLSILRRNSD